MNPKYLKALLAFCLLLCWKYGYPQTMNGTGTDPKLSAASAADGTSLSGLSSPNLYDGSTNINIPIFQYVSPDGDNLGVSLSYNTKGIKADQLASVVGLGFNLSTGGSIVRLVKDLPDEFYMVLYPDLSAWDGGYVDYSKMRGRYNVSFETPTEAAQTDVYRDHESDDFMVSAGSLSFTFNIGKTGLFFTNPDRRAKIEILYDGTPVALPYPADLNSKMSFRITDEKGTQYYFKDAGIENRVMNSLTANASGSYYMFHYNCITNWLLDKVVASNGATVQYTYITTPDFSFGGYSSFSGSEQVGNSTNVGAPIAPSRQSRLISKITYPNNTTVDFFYDENPSYLRCDIGPKALQKVKVSSGSNCLYYLFDQAYFVAGTNGNTIFEHPYGSPCMNLRDTSMNIIIPSEKSYALKLKGVRIQSCDGTITEPYYSFDYDATPIGIRGSGMDYFGYYNGKLASGSGNGMMQHVSIPLHQSLSGVTYGMDKTPDINYMKAGILTKVKNAYGGELVFEYGAHNTSMISNPLYDILTFPNPGATGFLGENADDGLCLTSVTEKEAYHTGNFQKTTFTYENGQRFLIGGFFYAPTELNNATDMTAYKRSYNTTYVTSHQLVNGSNHGYGKVTMTTRDNNNNQLSKREMTFTNLKDATSNNQPRYLLLGSSKNYFDFPYADKQYIKDWEMGLPLTITEYDQNNRIVKKVENIYDFSRIDTTSSQTKQVINQKLTKLEYRNAPIINPDWGPDHLIVRDIRTFTDDYRPYRGIALLTKSKTYTYQSDVAYTLDSATYTYDSRNNPWEIVTNNSDGTFMKTINYYNYSVSSPTGTILAMNNAGLEKQVRSERWIMNGASLDKVVDATLNAYNYNSGKLTLKNMYALQGTAPISSASYSVNMNTAFSGGAINNFQKASEVILADVQGNPLESKILDQDIYKAMIWDTTPGQKRAEVMGARYNDIAYCSFDDNETDGQLLIEKGNVGYNLTSVTGTSFAGQGGYRLQQGATNITGAKLLTAGKSYTLSFWCLGGTPLVMIGNIAVPYSVPLATVGNWNYFELLIIPSAAANFKIMPPASGTVYIDEIRLFPTGTMMQSWTYEPLFGVSSTTDARGTTVFYEYDKLGRQTIVRDQQKNILSKTKTVVQGAQ